MGRFHLFLTLTDLVFLALFTSFGPWRIYYFWPFSAFWDPNAFIFFDRFYHFRNLTLFLAVFTILDADGFIIFGRFHYFGTLTLFLSVFTILDLDRFIIFGLFSPFWDPDGIHYLCPFSPFLDPDGFIIFGRFHHFRTLTNLLFLAVFTILGP